GTPSQKGHFPFESAMHGPKPELRWFSDHGKLEDFVIDDVSKQIEQGEFKRSEIAVIYDNKAYGPGGFQYNQSHAPGELVARLEAAGIPSKWVSRDVRSKELFDITTDRVSVVSIHSSKGIDYDLVYLLGLDGLSPTEDTRDQLIRLAYVAMTRSKYRLVIPYVRENDLIGRMKGCLKPGQE
ncbi:MAG: 3'-5' exonuclease, partial [Desulfatiglandales bacterium]